MVAVQFTKWHHSSVIVAAVLLAVWIAWPAAVDAQERTHDRVLILTPQPNQPGDTVYVHEMTHQLRQRAQNKFRHKWQVIGSDKVHELFVSSGFAENTIIGPEMVEQVARSLQAHAYLYGTFWRNDATPMAKFRMVDVSRSGLSGWMTVQGQPGDPPREFAERVADSLDNQVKAADFAKDCTSRRDRSDFRGARDRADRAFALYPNHPSTALCLSYVFEATRQPSDSMIWAYQKAARGDSLYMRAWEELARQYQRAGDTAGAVEAFARQLQANPNDVEMRFATAAGYVATKNYEAGLEVLEEGLRRNPDNLRFVRRKFRACLESETWACALDASARQYELDSTVVGDAEFYRVIFGLAQTVGDTAAMLRWSGEAVERLPSSVPFWQGRAVLLEATGDNGGALAAYERLVELNPQDWRSKLKVATAHGELLVVDTLSPLDTASFNDVDRLLQDVLASTPDTNVMTAVALEYLKGGQKIIQSQLDLDFGIAWAEKALDNDPRGMLTTQANFWLGYALFFKATPLDQIIVESQSCARLGEYQNYLRRATQALTLGRSVSEETAGTLLGYLQQLAGRPDQFRQSFCPQR
jgi:tetratricopeptide (TPR) repeat protein